MWPRLVGKRLGRVPCLEDLGPDYASHYFKHPLEGRPPDGLLILVKKSLFCDVAWSECDYKGPARLDSKGRGAWWQARCSSAASM